MNDLSLTIILCSDFQMAPKTKHRTYSDADLLAAIAEVKNNRQSIRATSVKYGIPYTTLNDKVFGRVPLKISKPGPSAYLTEEQETRLADYLLTMAKIGYGVDRKDVPNVVKEILDNAEKDGFIIPENKKFKDNR